jgi:hypothetical protein
LLGTIKCLNRLPLASVSCCPCSFPYAHGLCVSCAGGCKHTEREAGSHALCAHYARLFSGRLACGLGQQEEGRDETTTRFSVWRKRGVACQFAICLAQALKRIPTGLPRRS